jgi:ribosomal protein S18 acetylase RimI-like enzyme
MIDELPAKAFAIRLATPDDIAQIELLDGFSMSPTRDIHRDIEKYFGTVDPSTHEHTFIFLAELQGIICAKAELMLPPAEALQAIGYVKRVVVHPDYRGKGLAKHLMQHIIHFARHERKLEAVDLHVWEGNTTAIHLYEALGFTLQHRELYYRLRL